MKLSSATILSACALLLAACNSLDNPFGNLFHKTGGDERVYNPQTGEWEWPPGKRPPADRKTGAVASASATPAPGDTRYWDPQSNRWVERPSEKSPASSKPRQAQAIAEAAAPAPDAPPTPRASRATGVYNTKTGKIEWQNPGGYAPAAASAPPPQKHWWWPF